MKQAERQKAAQEEAKKKGTGNSRKCKEREYSGTSSTVMNPKKTKAAKSDIGLQGREVHQMGMLLVLASMKKMLTQTVET